MSSRVAGLVVVAAVAAWAAQFDAVMTETPNYGSWNWGKAYVLTNDITNVALMPDVGARITRFKLGSGSLIRVDSTDEKVAVANKGYFGGGGFFTWPVPQDSWSWPPPPTLAYGPYAPTVLAQTADSVSIAFASATEQFSTAAGVAFRKVFTYYKGSSRLKVDHRMINKSTSVKTWGVRSIAQGFLTHPGLEDNENFWAYFPKGSSAKDSAIGYWVKTGDPAEVKTQFTSAGPGVVAYQCKGIPGQVCMHSTKPWLAYVDNRDGYCFVQKADYVAGGTYPEWGGAVLMLWFGEYLEQELCTPQKAMAAGDSSVFVFNQYAARTFGPILDVSNAGCIRQKLDLVTNNKVTGKYGVFHKGRVDVMFNNQTAAAAQIPVSPLDSLVVNQAVTVPAAAGMVSLLLYNSAGTFIDTLDSKVFGTIGVARHGLGSHARLSVSYVNGLLRLRLPAGGTHAVGLSRLDGTVVLMRTLAGAGEQALAVGALSAGTYVATAASTDRSLSARFSVTQ